ncbi:MAG: hypothetical protein K8H88_11350 [Sandaracinaceae bacterium]|nr:hypothetical protein [Sandaracinaceae bacterium]
MPAIAQLELLFVVAALVACSGAAPAPSASSGPPLERVDLHLSSPNGLSGLAADEQGRLWAIAERERVLLRIVDGRVEARVPIDGVPEGLDTESLAYVGDGVFAAGTESMDEDRTSDVILLLRVEGERARVAERIEMPYALWPGVHAEENHGIEALCHVDGTLIAVLEDVLDDPRRQLLGRYAIAQRRWSASMVATTSERGKIAGLTCRRASGSIEALAIERHFETMRVVRFDPMRDGMIDPQVVLPLEGRLPGDPNLEGIELDGATIVLVVDNQYRGLSGPNELVRVTLPRP